MPRFAFALLVLLLLAPLCHGQGKKRLPPPDDDALKAAAKGVADAYKRDFDAAKSAQSKQALAQKILKDAAETRDDSPSQFAMLKAARKIASGIGDVDLAMKAVDALAERFEIDDGPLRKETLTDLQAQLNSPADHYQLTRFAGRVLKPLVDQDQFDDTQQIAALALASAKKASDPDLVKQWTRKRDQLAAQAKAFDACEAALKTLADQSADPAGNASAGQYYCFFKNDWRKGLPMLALGEDAALAELAAKDIAGAATTQAQLELAEAWHALAKKSEQPAKNALLRYAGERYRKALPGLSALAKRRVEIQIAEISDATGVIPKNEWIEILDFVELPKHQVENDWKREGLAIVSEAPQHCRHFKIPVVVDGSYELKVRAARFAGAGECMSISLNQTCNDCLYALNCWSGQCSGLSMIDGKPGDQNATRTAAAPIVEGRPYLLHLQVDLMDDKAAVNSLVDTRRYLRWTGPVKSLAPWLKTSGGFVIGECSTVIAVYSVQLKVKSGAVQLVD